jgi:hypothetical protein
VSLFKDKKQFDDCFWQGSTPFNEAGWQVLNPEDYSLVLELGINWDGTEMMKVFSLRDQKIFYLSTFEVSQVS